MTEYLQFLLLGMGAGAIIAAIALGLVLIHRSTGVVHLGYGAVASYVAYVYASLRATGAYPLPPLPNPLSLVEHALRLVGADVDLPDIPTSLQFTTGDSGPAIALGLALVTAVAIGLLSHYLVFRPLRYAPELAKIVASLGILLVLVAAIVIRFGSGSLLVPDLLPADPVALAGVRIPEDRFWLLLVVVVLTGALSWAFRFTRFGIATRAAAENERLAALRGVSADVQAGWAWVGASVMAGLVGILVSQVSGLSPMRITLLVIPALGAALMGAFASFVVAAATGLAIGMSQSALLLAQQRVDWLPPVDLPSVLPFVVIAAAMLVRGEALPSRAAVEVGRLPRATAWRIRPGVMVACLVPLAGLAVVAPYQLRDALNNSMIGTLLALSLVVVTGLVGQVSLAQMSLAGVAAFGMGTFTAELGWPFLLALPVAVAAATLAGILLSLPSLRTRGGSLAVITLAAAVAVQSVVLERDGWFGSATSKTVASPELLGLDVGPTAAFPGGDAKLPSPAFGLLLMTATVAAVLFVVHLRNSRLGQQMLAVRSDERAAAGAGVDVAKVKIAAFAISGCLAGLAGAMKAVQLGTFSSGSFGILASLSLLAYAYLGGIATVGGSLWTGILATGGLATVLTDRLVHLGHYEAYVAGIVLIATAVTSNEGIDGATHSSLARLRARIRPAGVSPGSGAAAGLGARR